MKRVGGLWPEITAFGNLLLAYRKPRCIAAWVGHAAHADSEGLRRALLGAQNFTRGQAEAIAVRGASRRGLEQQTGQPPVRQPQQEHP